MTSAEALVATCRQHDVLVLYLFGSRAGDGAGHLAGQPVQAGGSDLDVGVVFMTPHVDLHVLSSLQVALEDIFEPLKVDLVPLQRVDALFQFEAVSGHRVFEQDSKHADEYELLVMRRAAELLPVQRRMEWELFGFGGRR